MTPPSNLARDLYLLDPALNKGTAFSMKERDELGLHGLLPAAISSLDLDLEKAYGNFCDHSTPLAKWVFLNALQNHNETLFYKLALEHVEEMLPLIYTPTVGDASLRYSSLYKGGRGLFISYPLADRMEEMLDHLNDHPVDVIVVTDGERILGLGDLGVGGMAIPVGKLALYTLFGGVHPKRTMPIVLDVGTDNEELLNDPLYLGWRHQRLRGEEYMAFIDQFVKGVKKRLPQVLLQWEDFGKNHARPLLEKYRHQICSFNDDIQGTASVALGAILSAVQQAGTKLEEQKIAVLGAGSAGIGICDVLCSAMMARGIPEEKAQSAFYVLDRSGLMHSGSNQMDPHQKRFARKEAELKGWGVDTSKYISLLDTIQHAHPTILIGVSGQPGTFTREMIETMAQHVKRPVILPLSNPTSRIEATPADIIKWSSGRAIIATGSPFAPVEWEGRRYPIAQCNNVYIFPGVGLGVIASGAKEVSEGMFLKASEVLSEHSPMRSDPSASLFPSLKQLREISQKIALAVALEAVKEELAPPTSEAQLRQQIAAKIWSPSY